MKKIIPKIICPLSENNCNKKCLYFNKKGFCDKIAKKCWEKLENIEIKDEALLIDYCLSLAKAIRAEFFLRKNGFILKSANGYEQPRPEVAIAREAWKEVRSCIDRLGLSPMARQKLNLEENDFFDLENKE